ncbi:MAG: PorP/SprF family type IX secretion system membrane protein [Saprospiraceae bacterium]
MNIINKYRLILFGVLVLWGINATAQSRYFDERYIYTQAQLQPQLINPGAFGAKGNHNVLLNYRNKWAGISGTPKTITLAYNGAIGNGLGIGVNVVSDRYGFLESTKGAAGLSYTVKTQNNRIGFGITGEYIKHSLSGFGNADPTDPFIVQALSGTEYFDASFGLYGTYMEKFNYGIALPSAVSSRISGESDDETDRTLGFILQMAYKMQIHPDVSMQPGFIFKKLNQVPTHMDLNLVFGFLQDKLTGGLNYTFGADKRVGFLIGTRASVLNIFYSYNSSSSVVQDYNNGSHELTLSVDFGGKKM